MKQTNKIKKTNNKNRLNYNYKEVALTKMAKRQLVATLLSILGVTIVSLGSAYAFFTSISKSADYNVIKVGTLNIDFGEESSNTINLSGQYPMSDEEGLKLTPYTFTIENTGTLPADYEIFIQDDTDMIEQDNCANNQLNKDYIKYKLNEGEPLVLSTIAGNDYKIASGSLEVGQKETYTLYVWIKEGSGNDVLNKHYHGKLVINGASKTEAATDTLLAKVNSEDLDYDSATSEQQKEMWTFSHPATEQTEALTDYRYIGKDPNNYVTFNDETWRIIGVFTVDDGMGNKEERLKIIRDESIGSYSWDSKTSNTGAENSYGKNNWSDAHLNYLLNPGHESESTGGSLYWNSSNGNCYTDSGEKACDFTESGLSQEARNMIGNTLWYLGGTATYNSASNGLASHFYSYERGTTVYTSSDALPRDTSWVGKVGLIYPSDYGYATSGGTTTDRNACLNKELSGWNNSSYSDCKNNDWLHESTYSQWSMTPASSGPHHVLQMYSSGYFGYSYAVDSKAIRPVVFLKSSIKIIDGDGSVSNPYILQK